MTKHLSCTLLALLTAFGAAAQNERAAAPDAGGGLLAVRTSDRPENSASASVKTETETAAAPDPIADSIAQLNLRLRPKFIESTFATDGLAVIDTLATANDADRKSVV